MTSQLKAFEKFKRLKVGALFMQMGSGKTKVAIDLINFNADKVNIALFICPNSTKENLKKEILKWGLLVEYLIISYETISQSDRQYLNLLKMIDNKKIFIVADESIFIKNEKAKRYKRILYLRAKASFALVLNGTPLTKNEWDLYNQMFFLSPKIINMSRDQFLSTFFTHVQYKKRGQKEKDFYKFSEVNAGYLNKLVAPYILQSNLDIDIKVDTEYTLTYVSEEATKNYKDCKEEVLKFVKQNDKNSLIKHLSKMQFIAATCTEKNNKIKEFIRDRQVICFCNYLLEVKQISENLDCFIIDGSVKNNDRVKIIEEFKNAQKPLLITLGTGSYGLNLQFCNEIVFASFSFDYGKIEQAKYRIKRIGQERDIKYTYFFNTLKINNLMRENLDKKATLKQLVENKLDNKEGFDI